MDTDTRVDYNQHYTKEKVFASYDDLADYFGKLFRDRAIAKYKKRVLKWIRKYCAEKTGQKIVVADVGCGAGYDLVPMKEISGENSVVVGVDPSPDAVKECRKRFPQIQSEVGTGSTLRTIPSLSGGIDIIRMDRVLQHLEHNTLLEVLNEVSASLKPGGIFIAIDPDWTGQRIDLGFTKDHSSKKEDEITTFVNQQVQNFAVATTKRASQGIKGISQLITISKLEILDVFVDTCVMRSQDEIKQVIPPKGYEIMLEMNKSIADAFSQAFSAGTVVWTLPIVSILARKPVK